MGIGPLFTEGDGVALLISPWSFAGRSREELGCVCSGTRGRATETKLFSALTFVPESTPGRTVGYAGVVAAAAPGGRGRGMFRTFHWFIA